MDTKNLKRPVLPALCLLFSVLVSVAMNVVSVVSGVISLVNYLALLPWTSVIGVVISILSSIISPLLYILALVLCLMLFLKKKNGLLVASVGIYNLLPIGLIVLSVVNFIPNVMYIFVYAKYIGTIGFSGILGMISQFLPLVNGMGLILLSVAAIVLFIISLSAWDKIFKKPKAKKMQGALKKLFWLPAVIYLLAILLFWSGLALSIVINCLLNINLMSLLNTIVFDALPLLITTTLNFVFFLTFGLWLKNPYKKGMEPTEEDKASENTEKTEEESGEYYIYNNEE